MKKWYLIRAIRFLTSSRWLYFSRYLKHAREAFDRGAYDVAESWIYDAEMEWKHLEAIRDGRE